MTDGDDDDTAPADAPQADAAPADGNDAASGDDGSSDDDSSDDDSGDDDSGDDGGINLREAYYIEQTDGGIDPEPLPDRQDPFIARHAGISSDLPHAIDAVSHAAHALAAAAGAAAAQLAGAASGLLGQATSALGQVAGMAGSAEQQAGSALGGAMGALSGLAAEPVPPAKTALGSALGGLPPAIPPNPAKNALDAAQAEFPASKPLASQPCPENHWIEIVLVDQEDKPVADIAYRIVGPDGAVHAGKLDQKGFARVDGLPAGTCQVGFPTLEDATWERQASRPK